MSIVLPRRKKIDIISPSKTIQYAKNKLGPGYFDPTLLECSKNAAELTRLVHKWEDIDKKRLKYIRELYTEQERLIRALKCGVERIQDDDPVKSIEGVETPDGKTIPPGFRFKANGDLKKSKASFHILQVEHKDNGEVSSQPLISPEPRETPNVENNQTTEVDYDKEIKELESVLYNIYKTLLKNRIDLFKNSSGKTKTYLRGHINEYTPPIDTLSGYAYESPNDRFAFKPGCSKSEYLSRKKVSNPTTRACIGCEFRLKASSEPVKNIVRDKADVGRRRWSYVPQGKYVESSTALSTISLARKPSKAVSGSSMHLHTGGSNLRIAPSERLVHFLPNRKDSGIQADYGLRKAITTHELCLTCRRKKSAASERELFQTDSYSWSTDSGLVLGLSGTTLSWKDSRKSSGMWKTGSESFSRAASRPFPTETESGHYRGLLVDKKEILRNMKMLQLQAEQSCREKVKDYLTKMDSTPALASESHDNTYQRKT